MLAYLGWVAVASLAFAMNPSPTWAEESDQAPPSAQKAAAARGDEVERYGSAADPGPADDDPQTAAPPFAPPPSGQPMRVRIASGRGPADPRPVVSVLAPEPCGETRATQPVLFWHVDRVPDDALHTIFALTTEPRDAPVTQLRLAQATRPGLQRIALADHGVRLEEGVVYEWSVALVPGGNDWGRSIFAIAGIRLLEDGAGEHPSPPTWYDAFAVADGIASRQTLLRAVGLGDLVQMP